MCSGKELEVERGGFAYAFDRERDNETPKMNGVLS